MKSSFDESHEWQPIVSASESFQESEESLDDDQVHAAGPANILYPREVQTSRKKVMRTDSHARYNLAFLPSRAATDRSHKWSFNWARTWSKMISAYRSLTVVMII